MTPAPLEPGRALEHGGRLHGLGPHPLGRAEFVGARVSRRPRRALAPVRAADELDELDPVVYAQFPDRGVGPEHRTFCAAAVDGDHDDALVHEPRAARAPVAANREDDRFHGSHQGSGRGGAQGRSDAEGRP